ncbi:hypothetical protein [Clostridium sp. UBA7339]|uniref:hypothetical protein n=1 Tax=Clostridium sp. UBA7339 TaxID=1946376 RepID=UPI003216D12A
MIVYKKEDDLLNKDRKRIISTINEFRDESKCMFNDIKFKCNSEDKKGLKKNHLIQMRNYLDSIAYNGKVMICNIEDENYYRYGRKMREVHVKKAHRYKVFCEVHDKKLFDSIENGKEFNINNKEQCFQFALRAFTFDYSRNCIKNNFSSGNKYIDRVAELSLNKSNKVFERFKQCYVEDEWSEIETYSIILDKKIKFISCCCFYPFIDLKRIYKGYVKEEAFFNIFPQGNKTYIVISYFKDSNHCRKLCKQIDEYAKKNKYEVIEKYFSKILACQDINLTLGPQLWNSWSEKEQEDFYRYAHKLKAASYKNFSSLMSMLVFKNNKFHLFKDFNYK